MKLIFKVRFKKANYYLGCYLGTFYKQVLVKAVNEKAAKAAARRRMGSGYTFSSIKKIGVY